jgi:hypothetical protein
LAQYLRAVIHREGHRYHAAAAARSSLSAPRMTILSALSYFSFSTFAARSGYRPIL